MGGLVHIPKLSDLDLRSELSARGVAFADVQTLERLPEAERLTSVVVVQDAFTSHYDTPVLLALLDLLIGLEFG